MFPTLDRPDATLSPVTLDDAPTLFAAIACHRSHLRPWMPWEATTQRVDDTEAFITDRLAAQDRRGEATAVVRFEGEVVGVIGQHNLSPAHGTCALGYWLVPSAQGHGLITDGVRAFVDHAFTAQGLHRVEIRASTRNRRSCAVPERLGFRREGVLRGVEVVGPHRYDHAIYSVIAPEWPTT